MYDKFITPIIEKVLPIVYDESLSYLETVNKLVNYVNEMVEKINSVIEITDASENNFKDLVKGLQDLKTELEYIKDGKYIKDGSISLSKLDQNLVSDLQLTILDYIRDIAKFVWFGIDNDGYFYAIIPSSWEEIIFSTDNEGHLILDLAITRKEDFK